MRSVLFWQLAGAHLAGESPRAYTAEDTYKLIGVLGEFIVNLIADSLIRENALETGYFV